MGKMYRIFDLFTKCKVTDVPSQASFICVDADEIEVPRSISSSEEDEDDDWDDDDDDDD